ncbi:preprotein translocase subunit SecG [Marinicella rhabdoformis]|uniref:preprotein translocase subunit SecG n=1 Tax=Marinicella rhabdoformis TaxID=2580566 RepID=UPI0012AEB4D0|nr:preprotein translocase subunit SecG [Marinicella rhabdoformis]
MTINFLNIIQVLVGIALIGFILIQRGPGATAGSAFGGGASGTVFGAKGSGSFLTKATAILATAFFIVTMLIAIDSRNMMGATGEATEQDLGVMGSIDNQDKPAVVIPGDDVDGNAEADQVIDDAIKQADDNLTQVKEEAANAVDNVVESTEAAVEEIKEDAEDVVSDEDGDQ